MYDTRDAILDIEQIQLHGFDELLFLCYQQQNSSTNPQHYLFSLISLFHKYLTCLGVQREVRN